MRIHKVLKLANEMEREKRLLIHLLMDESKKTLEDAESEVREAIDFCLFYAKEAEKLSAVEHPGVIGESNITTYHPRGKWLTINPWNFPLAILVGQTVAPYVMGNEVYMKAAERSRRIATCVHGLMGNADMEIALRFDRGVLEAYDWNGISFTGSHDTAKLIQKHISENIKEIIPFIAETSGMNYAVVDSSILLEQTVKDVARSAFNSNGQRCSSARQLLIQEDIAEEFIGTLLSHLMTWEIGEGIYCDYNGDKYNVIEGLVRKEEFKPVLRWSTYKTEDEVLEIINNSGYGLTLGIHSRVESFCNYIAHNAKVGNVYINRDQIGAVVESQPFGGVGLSGTGPKAGGLDYLKHFVYEKTTTTNMTALGGNVDLLG